MDTSEWLWIAACAFFLAAFIPRHHPVYPHILISNQRSPRGCLDNFYGDCFKRNHYRFSRIPWPTMVLRRRYARVYRPVGEETIVKNSFYFLTDLITTT